MKHFFHALLLLLGFALSIPAGHAVESLRGDHPLNENAKKPVPKKWQRDTTPIKRDYVQQPPLVPHTIEGYIINTNSNKCLSCHSWANYKDKGATKISLTHFTDRDGNDLANISARRYFCTQCHVP
ncbi:MAG: nitrate reductase cytochrome c-type subunit, partial [Gammaproteobacteria bacterium]|nr:nitrate reductase cytochrome c-type subunit [Gammaproteobacteria bacterium]